MNFMDIANQRMDEIERPKNLPIGTYLCQVDGIPEKGEVANGKYETLDFTFRIISAQDVDDEDLRDYGDITTQKVRHRFMFNTEDENGAQRSIYNLKRFLEPQGRGRDAR